MDLWWWEVWTGVECGMSDGMCGGVDGGFVVVGGVDWSGVWIGQLSEGLRASRVWGPHTQIDDVIKIVLFIL